MRTAFLVPGQGSQRPGMASAWLPGAADRYDELASATSLDLPAIADDEGTSRRTALSQPAVYSTSGRMPATASARSRRQRPRGS